MVYLKRTDMTELYKWQAKDYKALSNMLGRHGQTLLISARNGIGQDILIQKYTALLMCENPQKIDSVSYACNKCESCTLLINDNHPDIYQLVVDPESDKKNISTEDIRQMLDFVATTTHLGQCKIVLIPNVDLLSINSANALLKILEEPPSYVCFILQTTNISGILPTIRSRCHIYKLSEVNIPDAADYVDNSGIFKPAFWLKFYDNAPLFELQASEEQFNALVSTLLQPSIENIFKASSEFDAKNAPFLIDFLSKWLSDMAGFLQGAPMCYFADYSNQVENLAKRIELHKIYYLFDKVNFLQDWTLHPLNYKLQLENLLLQYQNLFVKQSLK
jgi:DNA polymerase-3 subunit delta'